ncbi:MAG: patatin-like phospholipase family protein [Candidatus Aegiribacteria sp.]|nr:patatin-like phospholipase family protein [Candidatus Aegiribacteria sp.]
MSNYLTNRIRSLLGRKTPDGKKKSIRLGLALGGGGARGLAHIPILELLDEMKIKPCCIAGTSIGAVMGALYASGLSGSEIRRLVQDTIIRKNDSPVEILKDIRRLVKLLDIDFIGPGVFKGDSIMKYLYDAIKIDNFDKLEIPLKVVTTDFWASSQVIISSGDLLQGVKASMGLPGLFTPVKYEDKILIDGGGVNPVPWDVLDECDLIVAVDVLGYAESVSDSPPNAVKAILDMFDIMQKSIVKARMKSGGPDVYIKPELKNIGILEFNRADEIYACAEASCSELEEKLMKFYPEIPPSS